MSKPLSALRVIGSLRRIRGHTVLVSALTKESVVIDAGAHKGEFGGAIARRYGCRCILVECNPFLVEELRASEFFEVVQKALSYVDAEEATFVVRDNQEAGSIFNFESSSPRDGYVGAQLLSVSQTSLESLLAAHNIDCLDLLKLDVEGAEFGLLLHTDAERLQEVRQISVEFHDFLEAFRNPGLFTDVRRRLAKLGFVCCPISLRTHGDVLFLNRKYFPISSIDAFVVRHLARYWVKAVEIAETLHARNAGRELTPLKST